MKERIFSSGIMIVTILSLFLVQTTIFPQETLEQKVIGAIANEFYNDFSISATADGHVTIKGNANTLYEKYRIFEIVSKVPGVKEISDQLAINAPMVTDKMIQSNILQEMDYVSSILEPDSIHVKVTNGVVFLDGKVSFYREKIMMKTVASWQEGVKGIVNRLEVMSPQKAESDKNLRSVLDQIMKYDYPLEENVSYTIENGKVTLKGTTTSLWAKYNIPETFLNVIGIKAVDNNLNVKPII